MTHFAVVLKGSQTPVRLNDRQRTLLVFASEVRANRVCSRMNRESAHHLYLRHYEVIQLEVTA